MPQVKTYTVYKFNELPKQAQDKALDRYRGLNVEDCEWWEPLYYDAAEIGLEITEFDNYSADGKLTKGMNEVMQEILANHGEGTATHDLAKQWYADKGKNWHTSQGEIDLVAVYTRDLLAIYHKHLMFDSEYLQSDEAVTDAFEVNDYDFTLEGRID